LNNETRDLLNVQILNVSVEVRRLLVIQILPHTFSNVVSH